MSLEIRKYPDPILRRRAKEIETINGEVRKLATTLVQTLLLRGGLGLAAPQIGVAQRMILVDTPEFFSILINPVIVEASAEKVLGIEGCLSLPGIEAEVERAQACKVRALTLEEERVEFVASDLVARVIQHELDHLDGVLFIDYLSEARRMLLLKEYKRKQKEKEKEKVEETARVALAL